jgi:predicted nucleic acid-binding protein
VPTQTVRPVTVIYDACVLYPAPLRDLLMWLALSGLYRARWTDRIHDEWISAVLRERPGLKVNLERTRTMMNAHVHDCLVTGYEPLVETLDLPDPDDRHVLAAAIAGRADFIITKNLSDFPANRLVPFRIEAQHPDIFVRTLLDLDETTVLGAVAAHRASLQNPPKSIEQYLDTLTTQELPQTVAFLRRRRTSL